MQRQNHGRRLEKCRKRRAARQAKVTSPQPAGRRLFGATVHCRACLAAAVGRAARAGGQWLAGVYSEDHIAFLCTKPLCNGRGCRVDHAAAGRLLLAQLRRDHPAGRVMLHASPGWGEKTGESFSIDGGAVESFTPRPGAGCDGPAAN